METIIIPSPTTLLRASQPSSPIIAPNPVHKRKPTNSRTHKPSTTKRIDGVEKPKQSKSRNGCATCKAKRLKCDETKPSCRQCHKRNVDCGGYKKDYKWRPFEEATFATKPAPQKAKKAAASVKFEPLPPESPSTSDASGSTTGPFSTHHASFARFPPQISAANPVPTYVCSMGSRFGLEHSSYPQDQPQYTVGQPLYEDNMVLDSSPLMTNLSTHGTNQSQSSITGQSSFTSGQSPRLIDLLLPGSELNAPPNTLDYLPQQSDVPYQPGRYSPLKQEDIEDDEDVEDVVRQDIPAAEEWVMRLPSPSPSSSSSSSDNTQSDAFKHLSSQPKLAPESPEMLMMGFDQNTCGILSVKDGPTENPWRTLVWPLVRESPALYHAISSMTAFHASKNQPSMKVEGMEHMRRSILYLASGIENMRTDTALATTLVLAFAESWDVHVSTGIEHLRGAKILMKQALTRRHQSIMTTEEIQRLRFLCNTWVYMDVIARLTSVDDDESNDFITAVWPSPGPFTPSSEIDPLMGCASTLFPHIGRVANLVRKVRKSSSNSINIISQANDLKTLIESWQPPRFFERPEDPTSDVEHSLQTAEAYRWATLLYLHQAVPEIPSEPASQLAEKVLKYLATVPLSSRTIIVHIYPLLAAGCEADSAEDRAWVNDRWISMSQRMLIGNIDRCLEVTKEVWDRRNKAQAAQTREHSRRSGSRMSANYASPVIGMKRAFSAEEQEAMTFFEWPNKHGGLKRHATIGENGMPERAKTGHSGKQSFATLENMEIEKTVRGRLHWVGVMKDWNWEILLG